MSKTKIINESLETVSLDKVRPHPANPREGNVAAIQESIGANGFYGAIVVQRSTGHILAGNHRWKAAKEAGLDSLPVIYVDVDDERAMRILLADNRTNDLASYNQDALAQLLEHLYSTDDGLTGTGYDGDALDELLDDLGRGPNSHHPGEDPGAEVDRAEELREKWQTERGQIWQIGRHRLMCGDSTDRNDWDALSIGRPAMVFTSPPYGVGDSAKLRDHYVPGAEERESLYASHKDAPDDWPDLMRGWIECALECVDVVAYNVQMLANNKRHLIDLLYEYRSHVVDIATWDKMGGAPQMQSGVMTNVFEWIVILSPEEGASRKMPLGSWHGTVSNIVRADPRGRNENADVHGAVMPVEVAEWAIVACDGAQSIVDPFAGTGTSIIAAERQNRTCCAIEIDPKYVAVTLERLSKMGLEPKLLESLQIEHTPA